MKRGLLILILSSLMVACGESSSEDVSEINQDIIITIDDSYQTEEDKEFFLPSFFSNDTFSRENVNIDVNQETIKKGVITGNGSFYKYIPPKGFSGVDSFNYTICSTLTDDNCSTSTVTINVIDEGSPSAKDDVYYITKNQVITFDNFLQNDSLIDDAIIDRIDDSNSNGNVVLNSDGTISYTPNTDFIGEDSFTYFICDDDADKTCSSAKIVINILEPNNFNIPFSLMSYYNGVDFSLIGSFLKDDLSAKIINTHTRLLSYTPDVWEVLKKSDLDPTDSNKVLLVYGYNDSDGIRKTDRSRGKDENGGGSSDWNREHVYPRSLGNPNLGTVGAGADAHHLRPCDAAFNSERSNKRFASGSGNAGDSSGGWYPGDEWKGDIARMMMYMYLRYGNQCLPNNVAIGNINSRDENMIDLLLKWNIEDPISDFEINRNNVIADEQGNRNPFIDNPYLATIIWGGEAAQNTWE